MTLDKETRDILNKLSDEDKAKIFSLIASPRTVRQRSAARKALTDYMLDAYRHVSYFEDVAVLYSKLLSVVLGIVDAKSESDMCALSETDEWKECHEDDRVNAIMMFVKKHNRNIAFKKDKEEVKQEVKKAVQKKKVEVVEETETDELDEMFNKLPF